jgi:hypothetical protein
MSPIVPSLPLHLIQLGFDYVLAVQAADDATAARLALEVQQLRAIAELVVFPVSALSDDTDACADFFVLDTAVGPIRPDSLATSSPPPSAARLHPPGVRGPPTGPGEAERGEAVSLDDPVLAAENLWRRLVEHQPAVAAALGLRVRELPQDWPQRELGVFRPEAAFRLPPSEQHTRVEIAPYDTDWENCGACSEALDLCRYHTGFETRCSTPSRSTRRSRRPPCSSGWPTTTRTAASRPRPRTPERCRDHVA